MSKITLYENSSVIKPEYQQKIQKKIDDIDLELKVREMEKGKALEYKFIGLASYDLRVFFVVLTVYDLFPRKTRYSMKFML